MWPLLIWWAGPCYPPFTPSTRLAGRSGAATLRRGLMAASSVFHWEITLSGLISWICLWKGLWHLVLSWCKVLMRSDPRGSERWERRWQGRQRRAQAATHPPTHSGLGISHTDTWFSPYEECVLDSSQMENKDEWKRASWNLESTMAVKMEQKFCLVYIDAIICCVMKDALNVESHKF